MICNMDNTLKFITLKNKVLDLAKEWKFKTDCTFLDYGRSWSHKFQSPIRIPNRTKLHEFKNNVDGKNGNVSLASL